MKRTDLIPALLLLPVLGFVAVQAMHARTPSPPPHRPHCLRLRFACARTERALATPEPRKQRRQVKWTRPRQWTSTRRRRDVLDIRRRIELGATGTYIGEILGERDSALARWPERLVTPVRVWVGNSPTIEGWDRQLSRARSRRLRRVGESRHPGEVHLRPRFARTPTCTSAGSITSTRPISGKTIWARDTKWWIVSANITLALHHNAGELLDPKAIHAIALHEVGHLLGLDHTADTTNIMTARVRVRDLSEADRATMKLLYSLPPGSVK